MKFPKLRAISGTFSAFHLGGSAWRLAAGEPSSCEIYLLGVGPNTGAVLSSENIDSVRVEWRQDGVGLTFGAPGHVPVTMVRSVILHEPAAGVFDGLPLSSIDANATKFWRRVFRLLRVPGGRYLLRLITPRSRR